MRNVQTPISDPSLKLLLQHLSMASSGKILWIADEQNGAALSALTPWASELTLLSNRYDVAQQALQLGLEAQFSDWVLCGNACFDSIYLRVCKEKGVNLHLLRLARSRLAAGGQLILAGQKNEGIKSLAKYADALFDSSTIKKHGNAYIVTLQSSAPAPSLDLSDYHQVHPVACWRDIAFRSKLGVYGWDKIDRGSELLVDIFERYMAITKAPCSSLLDIGCGYGFLSLAASALPCSRRVATDNNAAALLCARINAAEKGLPLEVVAGDCADTVTERFDIVLCNPPFHKGFDVEADLGKRFVDAAASHTEKCGTAFFVVNSFIPLEKPAQGAFRTLEVLANNGQFKVLALKHPLL